MHESKVNTKASEVGKNVFPSSQYAGSVATPYGVQLVNRGDALDHAIMCGSQLRGLLRLIGPNADHFDQLPETQQANLMWLVRQLAEQSEALFEIVAADAVGGAQ